MDAREIRDPMSASRIKVCRSGKSTLALSSTTVPDLTVPIHMNSSAALL
jgi:hypothetical protein